MSWDILPLVESDYEELLRLLDRCFAPHSTGFDTLLPAQFTDRARCAACNYGIREGGKLVAVVGVYPIEWQVGDRVLRVGGIGNVATDPDHRGKGLMSQLLQHVVRTMAGLGFDLSWLGGYRKRYAQFGYEKAGLLQQFVVTSANIQSLEIDERSAAISLIDPRRAEPNLIAKLKALHDRQPIHCIRDSRHFPLYLANWRRKTWVSRDPATGTPRAYAVASADGKLVTEIAADDADAAKPLVAHLVRAAAAAAAAGGSVEFQCNALAGPVGVLLHAIAEHRSVTTNGNWLIFDWPKVLGALLDARQRQCPLPRGAVVLQIDGGSANVLLQVGESAVGATWTEKRQPPDLSGDALMITRALLGPTNPAHIIPLDNGHAALLNAWCPLPAGFSPQDYV